MAAWRVPSPTRASLAALRQVTETVRQQNENEQNERASAQKEKAG